MGLTRKEIESNVERIEVVGTESRFQNIPNLVIIAGHFEFLGGSTDGKVVDENLGLLERALRDASQLSEFQVAQALDADPDADSKYCKNQAQGAARRPQEKQ